MAVMTEGIPPAVKKEISRLRSETRKLGQDIEAKIAEWYKVRKDINPFTGIVSGNYWTQTGMPWVSGEGRKAVLTEYFWQPIRGQPRRVDTNELRQFCQTFWINTCVKTLVDEMASLDWDIVPKDGFEYDWVQEGIDFVKDFLRVPNHNGENFKTAIIRPWGKDLLEIDAGIIVKVFDIQSYDFDNIEPKSGAPTLKPLGQRKMTELYVRDGASFLKEIDKFGYLKGFWQYSYQIPAHPMWFNRDEIVYTMEQPRGMSCYGFARSQAILDIVKSLHYSTLFNKKYFEETAIPDLVLSLLDTSETEQNIFRNYWNNELKGQPHKVAIVNKDVKVNPLSITNVELQFLETQRWYMNLVISQYGLTPTELGITEDANRSVSATQAELVKRKGIRPLLKLFEDYFNAEIMPEFGYEGIEFQFIYDDPAEKAARLANWEKELNMGVKTPNEVREEMGLEPVEGGDVPNTLINQLMAGTGSTQQPGSSGQTAPEKAPKEGDNESPGYEEALHRAEGKTKELEQERKERIQNPYGDANRPVGLFNAAPEVNLEKSLEEQLRIGIEVEREHQASLKLTDEEVEQIARDHLREDPEYYTKLRNMEKAGYVAPVGAYYNDTPISMPRRPSGADHQPQNPKPTNDFPRDNSLRSQPPEYADTNPSHLGDNYSQPNKHKWNNKDKVRCPQCGQTTLSALEALAGTTPDDVKCMNCGATFRGEDLLMIPVMEEMSRVLTASNSVEPISIPAIKPKSWAKSFDKELDINMSVKEYCGHDVSKSLYHATEYAGSKEYKNLIKDYLSDLPAYKREKIIALLKNGLRSAKSMREISKQIEDIVKDAKRAELITRTEIVRLSSEGNLLRMKDKGTEQVEYISAPEDGRLCPDCKALDGKIFTIKEARGLIPQHPRCRCLFTEHYEA